MTDIQSVMESLISQYRSIDVAESEFRKLLYEDAALKKEYKNWCHQEGYTERQGFIEFCNAQLDLEEDRWDVLSDPDDEI